MPQQTKTHLKILWLSRYHAVLVQQHSMAVIAEGAVFLESQLMRSMNRGSHWCSSTGVVPATYSRRCACPGLRVQRVRPTVPCRPTDNLKFPLAAISPIPWERVCKGSWHHNIEFARPDFGVFPTLLCPVLQRYSAGARQNEQRNADESQDCQLGRKQTMRISRGLR